MNKLIVACIFSLCSLTTFAQKNWVKQKLTSKFSVAFPVLPTKATATTYSVKDSNNVVYTATYSFIAENLKINNSAIKKLAAAKEFSKDFLESLQEILPQYNLRAFKVNEEKNYTNYLVEGKNESEAKNIFMNIIFVDGIYYSLSCVVPENQSQKNKAIFLNSFQLLK